MKVFPRTTCKQITYWAVFLILVAACSGITTASPAPPNRTAPLLTAPLLTPTEEDLQGLSVEEAATLVSLEKVADYPLYIMHFSGAYTYPETGQNSLPPGDFACSLFAALGQPGDLLFGRNFDWEFSPALLLFTDPPDGYASVSIVDLTFLGINPDTAAALTGLPLAQRKALLSAPSMPFDGMNEYGLTIAMAAVPESSANGAGYDPAKPTIGSIGIIRQILDHARNVEEAVKQFEQYNIDFAGGPPIHYLIADPSGKAALIELYDGKLVVLPNDKPWHLATNHLRCITKSDGGCPRYHTLSGQLAAANGQIDERAAMRLLSEVAQSSTQWSVVYNMSSGDVSVVLGQSYRDVFPFHLDTVH